MIVGGQTEARATTIIINCHRLSCAVWPLRVLGQRSSVTQEQQEQPL